LPSGASQYTTQFIRCVAEKNRLKWSFYNFFASADRSAYVNVEFTGDKPVVPKTWSHHIVRFDSATGMIEYAVDGHIEAITYATITGREAGLTGFPGNEVYTPFIGLRGVFSLGSRYTGFMDEFRVHSSFVNQPFLQKFSSTGRLETRIIDLGAENSKVYRIDARGGRTSLQAARGSIEHQENGRFRFRDDTEMQFFIRAADNPYWWNNSPWLVFTPGIPVNVRGRYMQLAVDFYPSANGEASPYLEELRIRYTPTEAPVPPSSLVAVASDGSVQLRWRSSPDMETDGYLVYYGIRKGDYFGECAILGVSPIDAGKQNSLFIDGLKNGVLYYFAVAAYKVGNTMANAVELNGAAGLSGFTAQSSVIMHIGEFSREVTARPLEGLQF
jgi:hypothetical protein